MEDYNYGYEYDDQQPRADKSLKGYKIIIVVLAVILVAVSALFLVQTNDLKKTFASERTQLTSEISGLVSQYDSLRTENDTIAYNLNVERERADSLLQKLTSERNLSRAKIAQYEKEVGTLRSVMRTYVQQIDSLNTLNKTLAAENVNMRTQVQTQRLRADKAEEEAREREVMLRKGSVIRARDINLSGYRKNDQPVTRAARADYLRVDLVLSANEIAKPGPREVYVRLTGPDGYMMTNAMNGVFEYEGEMKAYSAAREIDYQLQDLPVGVYYNGGGITAGTYKVEIYMDGYLIGNTELVLR